MPRYNTSRRRAREPQAAPQHEALAHVDTFIIHRGSRAQYATAPPREAKSHVYCGQNRLDPSLRVNNGELEVGTRSKSFRSGFGAALHQQINDEEAFIKKLRSSGAKTARRPRGTSPQRSVKRDSAASVRGAPRWRASCRENTANGGIRTVADCAAPDKEHDLGITCED